MKENFYIVCAQCNTTQTLYVDPDDVEKWHNGAYVQDAFPYLRADQRELLISQTCGTCWDRLFPLWEDQLSSPDEDE